MSSTSVWLPLAVAAVGVAGTLSATWLTRRSADRREDQRWTREREAEETRWQRERDERREEWQREDAARWLTDRRAVYAEYLLSLRAWTTALYKVHNAVQANGTFSGETRAALVGLEEQSSRLYEMLSVISPKSIVDLSAGSFLTLGLWSHHLRSDGDDEAINPFSGEKTSYPKDSVQDDRRLRRAIRQDLGVDPPSA